MKLSFHLPDKLRLSKTVYTWLISYLLILIFPIAISFVPYFYTERALLEKIGNIDQAAITSSQRFIDNTIDNVANTAFELLENETLEELSQWEGTLTPEQIYQCIEADTVWNVFSPFANYIENMYVYFPHSEYLYYQSRLVRPDDFFFSHYQDRFGSEAASWKDSVLLCGKTGVVTLPREAGQSVFYVASKNEIGTNKIDFNVIVEFNVPALIAGSGQSSQNTFYLCLPNGDIVYSDVPAENAHLIQTVSQSAEPQQTLSVNNERFVVSQLRSQSGPWYYGNISPEQEYREAVVHSRIIMIIAAFISVICGGIFIFFSIRTNNRPLRELVRKLSGSDKDFIAASDEYKYINDLFIKTMNEKKEYETRISLQTDGLKEQVLLNLIEGRDNDRLSQEQQLESVGIHWTGDQYVVIVFYIGNLEQLFFEQHSDDKESFRLAKLITINIVTELLNQSYDIQMLQKNDLLLGIVNFQESQKSELAPYLRQIFEEMNDLLRREFNFSVLVAISDTHVSLSGLPEGYNEAILGIEYLNLCEQNIVEYSDISIQQAGGDYPYSSELEQQIINSIQSRNFQKCEDIVNGLVEGCMSRSFLSIQMVRYFSYDLLSTFLKVAVNQRNDSLRDFLVAGDTIDFTRENGTSRSLLLHLKEVVIRCIDLMKDTPDDVSNETIYCKIKAFVDEHYDNPNINVNEISNLFHINASQLSSRFKQIFGTGLLDYISQRRVEMAKHLLTTTDMPVHQIAQQVGYNSQRTFLRVFSNVEKITPGKYRQLYAGSESPSPPPPCNESLTIYIVFYETVSNPKLLSKQESHIKRRPWQAAFYRRALYKTECPIGRLYLKLSRFKGGLSLGRILMLYNSCRMHNEQMRGI